MSTNVDRFVRFWAICLSVPALVGCCPRAEPEDEIGWQVWPIRDAVYLAPTVENTPAGGVLAIAVDSGTRDPDQLGSREQYDGEPRASALDGEVWRIDDASIAQIWPGATRRFDLPSSSVDIEAYDPDWYESGLETIALWIDRGPPLTDMAGGSPTLSADQRIFFSSDDDVIECGVFSTVEYWAADRRIVFTGDVPVRVVE